LGTEQTFKKAAKAAALKAYVFLFCNIHTQTGYYKKGINY